MRSDSAAAHLALLALFEGGSEFWSGQYLALGAEALVERIADGAYSSYGRKGESLPRELAEFTRENREKEFDLLESLGAFLLTRSDPQWPKGLDDLKAPPIALICRGPRNALGALEKSLSIVGTRNPTIYGQRIAGEFAAGAVDRGWSVVSGGALGIDTSAHKGALVAEGQTFAILGCGVRRVFPGSNERIFHEIMENGLLISETLADVHAIPARFLIRNRLIAAISRATVVVEAAFRSGSLRTARDAAEIFRPVLAVPGPITSPASDGCHRLIGERSAEIVTSVADLMELVGPLID
jgi:DNA protecting protein DprA